MNPSKSVNECNSTGAFYPFQDISDSEISQEPGIIERFNFTLPRPPSLREVRATVERAFGSPLPKDTQISLKELAAVTADSYITDSKLEGISSRDTLTHALHYCSYLPGTIIADIKNILRDQNERAELGAYAETLANRVKNDKRALFIGGYKGTLQGDPGHALLFEIHAISQSLRIYNQGDGLEYHMSSISDGKKRYGSYYEKVNIPKQILESPYLYMTLLSPNYFMPRTTNDKWTADAIYRYVQLVLPGNEKEPSCQIAPQLAGTCARKSFLSWLKTSLTEAAYNRLIFAMKITTFARFEATHALTTNEQLFIKEVAGKIARSANDMLAVHAITPDEYAATQHYLHLVAEQYKNTSIHEPTAKIGQLQGTLCPLLEPKALGEEDKITYNEKSAMPTHHLLYDGLATYFPEELIFTPVKDPSDVLERLNSLLDHVKKLGTQKRTQDAIQVAILALTKLPRLHVDDTQKQWAQVPEAARRGCIDTLFEILGILNCDGPFTPTAEYSTMRNIARHWIAELAALIGITLYSSKNNKAKMLYVAAYTTSFSNFKPNSIAPHSLPGVASILYADMRAFKEKQPPSCLHFFYNKNELNIQHANNDKIESCMVDLLAKDLQDETLLKNRICCWKDGKSIKELITIVDGEEQFNTFKKLILCQLLSLYGLTLDQITSADTACHKEVNTNICKVTFPFNLTDCTVFTSTPSTAYSLSHRFQTSRQDITTSRPVYNYLLAFEWLEEITKNPSVLIDSGQMIVESLSLFSPEDGAFELGATPLERTLSGPEAKAYVFAMQQACNKVLQQRDALWKERVQNTLRIATIINLAILRPSKAETCGLIKLEGVHPQDFAILNEGSPWPQEAFWLVCTSVHEPGDFLHALTAVTERIGTGDLYEALHLRLWHDHKMTAANFLKPLIENDWKHIEETLYCSNNEMLDLSSGLRWTNGQRPNVLPPLFRSFYGFSQISKLLNNPLLVPVAGQKDAWATRDDLCRFVYGNTYSLKLRGDLLIHHFGLEGKNFLNPSTYYMYDCVERGKDSSRFGALSKDATRYLNFFLSAHSCASWVDEKFTHALITLPTSTIPYLWVHNQNESKIVNTHTGRQLYKPTSYTVKTAVGMLNLPSLGTLPEVWKSSDGSIEVAVPEKNLHFTVIKKQDLLVLASQEYPGYHIVPKNSCNEAQGLWCELLRDEHGNELLIIPTLYEENTSLDLMQRQWKFCQSGDFHTAIRRASSSDSTNQRLAKLFYGNSDALLFIIRGLMRKRNYELAREYVDLLSKSRWDTSPVTAFILTSPMPLEHEKSSLLRLRLQIQAGKIEKRLVNTYYATYHLLPARWLLSPQEEAAIEGVVSKQLEESHKSRLEATGDVMPFYSAPTLNVAPSKPSNKDQLPSQWFTKFEDICLPSKYDRHPLVMRILVDSLSRDSETRLLNAYLLFYSVYKSAYSATLYLPFMQRLLSGEHIEALIDAPKSGIELSKTKGQAQILELAMGLQSWCKKTCKKIYFKTFYNKVKNELMSSASSLSTLSPTLAFTSRQMLRRAPVGKRMGSGFLESWREVEKRIEFSPREFLNRVNLNTLLSTTSETRQDHLQTAQFLEGLLAEIKYPPLKNELSHLVAIGKKTALHTTTTTISDNSDEILFTLQSEQRFLENELLRCLNSVLFTEPLTLEDAFSWLAMQHDDPKNQAAYNFASALERYVHVGQWIKALEHKNAPPYFDKSLTKGPRWALAAFCWLYSMQPRKEQAAAYTPLTASRGGYLAKLQTGAGKTSFYTKVLIHNAHCTVNVVPEEIISPHMRLLQTEMSSLGGVVVNRLKSSRNRPLMATFSRNNPERQVAVTTFRDLGSIVLNLYETLLKQSEQANCTELDGDLESEKLLSFFLHDTTAIFDEIHHLMRGNHELSFARKCKKGIPPERGEIAAIYFQQLVASGKLAHGKIEPITLTQEMQDHLAAHLIKEKFFHLTAAEKAFAQKYLTIERGTDKTQALNIETELQKLGDTTSRLLQIARAELKVYLAFTLERRLHVHYGQVSASKEARPYRGAHMPASGTSSFALLDTLINFTMQMYIAVGLTDNQVKQLIAYWKSLDPDTAELAFRRCIGADISIRQISQLDAPALQNVIETLAKSELAAIEYAQQIVLKEIVLSESKMRFTGASLASLFSRIVGFSATPNNSLGYPLTLRDGHLDYSADLETMTKLMDPECTTIKIVDEICPETLASEEDFYAVIDPFAALYSQNNEEIAKKILKGSRSQIARIAYFNQKADCWYTLDRRGKQEPLVESNQARRDLFYYVDQGRSIASDLPLPEDGRYRLLIHEKMPYHALHQGVGRCRKWGKGAQTIEVVVPKRLQLDAGTSQKLIKWTLSNGGAELQGVLVAMHRDLMHEVLRARFLHELLALRGSEDEGSMRLELVASCTDLLEEKITQNTFIEHASLFAPKTDREIIQEFYESAINRYSFLLTQEDHDHIKKLLESCLALLPEHSEGYAEESLFLTAENEQDIAVQREQELKDNEDLNRDKYNVDNLYKQITWQQKILLTPPSKLPRKLLQINSWGFQRLNQIVAKELFPDSMLISRHALGYRKPFKIASLLTPEMLPEAEQSGYYRQLPHECWIFRIIPTANTIARYILLGPKEANNIASHMRQNKSVYGFQGTLFSMNGHVVAHIGTPPSGNHIQTEQIIALTKVFLGSIRIQQQQESLKSWLQENPQRIQPLKDFLSLRLAHLKHGHPDHYDVLKMALFPPSKNQQSR